jgi:hypothetical protein
MGKRLYRIFEKDIPSKVSILRNSEINVVLKNKKTYFGILMDSKADALILKDPRMGIHQFPFSEISEIVYDGEAAY